MKFREQLPREEFKPAQPRAIRMAKREAKVRVIGAKAERKVQNENARAKSPYTRNKNEDNVAYITRTALSDKSLTKKQKQQLINKSLNQDTINKAMIHAQAAFQAGNAAGTGNNTANDVMNGSGGNANQAQPGVPASGSNNNNQGGNYS